MTSGASFRSAGVGLLGRMRRVVAVLAALALLTACTSAGGTQRKPAPKLTGTLLGGGTYDLTGHLGEVVVINFWASWCAPCRAEITDLESTYQATKAQGVSFIGINTRDEVDKANAFVADRVTYPSIRDVDGALAIPFAAFGATTIPATVVVDRQGRVAEVFRIPVRVDSLRPVVDRVAGEPRP